MGKQITFYADRVILEAINDFAQKRGLTIAEKKKQAIDNIACIPVDEVLKQRSMRQYFITQPSEKLPTPDEFTRWQLSEKRHLAVTLFMKGVATYDSRVWFQTGGNVLEKEGEALLRKVRSVIKKQAVVAQS